MKHPYSAGQRWISESEPELGLGSVQKVGPQTVLVRFAASEQTREYALDNAPLRRVRFRAGDSVQSRDGRRSLIEEVVERNGFIQYRAGSALIPESELCDSISFNKPEERLLLGQLDDPEVFDLRLEALAHQHRRRESPVRGFVGGRIDLIPHQLYLAAEVAGRMVPRVLLADEVGLGKTIEACLILHRLVLTGRAQRVLILVPESLVHQWFVELLRRFNLWFHIYDEDRCDAIETANPEANPFLDDQLVLAGISLFTGKAQRVQQAVAAGWDLLVVDEAHHLGWSPESASPEYAAVEAIGRCAPGMLLLTATPEQLGMASHFARLRLLDPDRFHDLNSFVQEAGGYREVARLAARLMGTSPLDPGEIQSLAGVLGAAGQDRMRNQDYATAVGRASLVRALLDQHGTGRVMFRNTRATISGFPRRIGLLCPIELDGDQEELFHALADEFAADTHEGSAASFEPDLARDPRLDWLAGLLRRLGESKVLLICRTQRKAIAIHAALESRINVKKAVFHEGIPLVQRDRSAAWFAEEDGARILICSEIGSEGRNFQFAHHLVLFDLPLDPELLEQRIGRLDRIGQTSEIRIHVPFVKGSSQEVCARWFHEGLHAFEKNLHGGRELLERFGRQVHDLAQDFHETGEPARLDLERLIRETSVARDELAVRLEEGRDRLLELNSLRGDVAARLVDQIRERDQDRSLDAFMTAVFDHFSIHIEEVLPRTYRLGSAGVFADSFPGLPAGGLTVTSDRQRAISHEQVQFLTWDHPLVTAALDMLLGSEKGNCSFARWPDARHRGLYLEAVFLLECIAPSQLHADRFLPPVPVRTLVDHQGSDECGLIDAGALARLLKPSDPGVLLEDPEFREELLPMLLDRSQEIARRQVSGIAANARSRMNAQLAEEIHRLEELQKVNRSVRADEIEALRTQRRELDRHLSEARLRLDAIRVIQRG